MGNLRVFVEQFKCLFHINCKTMDMSNRIPLNLRKMNHYIEIAKDNRTFQVFLIKRKNIRGV